MTVRKSSTGLIYGVGLNDADYVQQVRETIGRKENGSLIQRTVWVCPFYRSWSGMLQRGYSENWKTNYPTYAETRVYEDWHRFTTYKKWMETQPWEDAHLDKDILHKGNQLYCPESCVFIPQKINALLINCTSARGDYPIGVTCRDGRFIARVQDGVGGRTYLGSFGSSKEAHKAWQEGKADSIETVASNWYGEPTYRPDVVDALLRRSYQLRLDAANGTETFVL
jgi:hypothetical protein